MPKPKEETKKDKKEKVVCHACGGSGKYFDDPKEKCNFCDGTGYLSK